MIKIDEKKKKEIDASNRASEIKKELAESDWTQMPDVVERKGQKLRRQSSGSFLSRSRRMTMLATCSGPADPRTCP